MRWLSMLLVGALVVGCGGGGTRDGGGGSGGTGGGSGGGAGGGSGGGTGGGSGGGSGGGTGGGSGGGTGGGVGGGSGGGAGGGDAGLVANIETALNCGTPIRVYGTGQPGELQLYAVDQTKFPDAICNDGTPPIVYYRPYRGAANQNKWVIGLRGGGSCDNAANCASRWCSCAGLGRCPYASVTTNFTLDNMSGGGRRGSPGGGVMLRDGGVTNPVEDYNHVQFIYCSSDGWHGAARGVPFTTTHPITGQQVTYVLNFLGTKILEAELRVLRQDGENPLQYTLGTSQQMPDLDDATEVLLEGDSGGGAGIIINVDWMRDHLHANHNGCDGGAACPPNVVAMIDAITGPELSRLDFTNSAGKDAGIDTYAKFVATQGTGPTESGRTDQSCAAWHADGGIGQCWELSHVLRHHITTPFFVRQALLDALISRNYVESGVADPVLGPMNLNDAGIPVVFATVLQRELSAFGSFRSRAEEGLLMSKEPGVFGPACSKHDTIHDNTEVYGVSITPDGGSPLRLWGVFGNWVNGAPNSVLTTEDPMRADTVCPP